jgi:hypothetical protein
MFQSNFPKLYWSDVILMATYLINRLPFSFHFLCPFPYTIIVYIFLLVQILSLNNKSLIQLIYYNKPNMNHSKNFGCTCYVHQNKKDKLDHNSIKTIFLGYTSHKKRYKCYDPINKKIYISRDMTFIEDEPYYNKIINEDLNTNITTLDFVSVTTNQFEEQVVLGNEEGEENIHLSQDQDNEDHAQVQEEGDGQENELEEEDNIMLRRSTRIIQPFSRLRDFITYKV